MCEEREDWEYCINLIKEITKWVHPSGPNRWCLTYMGMVRTIDVKEVDWDLIFKSDMIPKEVKLSPRLMKYAIVFC